MNERQLVLQPEELFMLEDGFKYFDPQPNRGVYSAHHLRQIADALDAINKQWEEEIARHLEELNGEHGRVTDVFNLPLDDCRKR